MEILAERIRTLREETFDLSLEKFARLVDVSTKTISTWENNRGDPDLKSLVKIASACGVSTDYLLGLTSVASTGRGGNPSATRDLGDQLAARDSAVGARAQRQRRARRS